MCLINLTLSKQSGWNYHLPPTCLSYLLDNDKESRFFPSHCGLSVIIELTIMFGRFIANRKATTKYRADTFRGLKSLKMLQVFSVVVLLWFMAICCDELMKPGTLRAYTFVTNQNRRVKRRRLRLLLLWAARFSTKLKK